MNFAAIRDGLVAVLASVEDVNVYGFPPDQIEPVALIVAGFDDQPDGFDVSFGSGVGRCVVNVVACAARNDPSQIEWLDELMSTSGVRSLHAAVQADQDLAGGADSAAVLGWRDYGWREIGGVVYLAVTFPVEVFS